MSDYSDYGIQIPNGKRSGNVKTFCPKCHKDRSDKRDKSLSVNLNKGIWKCHHCEWTGALHDQERQDGQRGRDWRQLMPQRAVERTYTRPTPNPSQRLSPNLLRWFASRGISERTVRTMGITEGPEWMPQKDGPANTVQFNYHLRGELVNVKYRTGDKCFKMFPGARAIPYNIDAIWDTPECIITEGEMDTLAFLECGRTDVISVPNGANSNLSYLDDFMEDYFETKETIYIAADTDTKGAVLSTELVRRFGPERCRLLEYGQGCKDANEHLQRYGAASLLQCLDNARDVKVEGIFYLSDFETSLDALYENGMQKGVTIGHENFDRLCSFETKRLCIVTGIPASGKSEFIDEITERLNMRYGWRTAYFSPENAPLSYHASKIIEKLTGKRFGRKTLGTMEYAQAKEHLETDFFFIAPKDYTLTSILEKAAFLVRRKGIKCLVIDPYNRLDDENQGESETNYISKVLDRLTNFAQQYDVLVILMAHPTKPQRNKDGVIEAPTLYDISGSAHFFNKCDFGIVVHRDRTTDTVQVIVQKVKFRHLGECGTAVFKYNINNGRYVPYDGDPLIPWDNGNHLIQAAEERLQKSQASLFGDEDDGHDPDLIRQLDGPAPF